ncbi:hypothetical protein Rumeso_00529 [Rubellimicrobium mesophilum DSM 19309]|uniref:Secreted protein n=1 Tax=Rubellimicrobium mesophilum DSM 19309 TaxID=442562 RepID=A0A017HTG4_9RHOB|nr:hypothetical protein [Rubellimicrobium mesophilum]EYD77802.1 hypothetical protein Rumeso_00529 [Rubellimicrobium mesophilum DSM 19309]
MTFNRPTLMLIALGLAGAAYAFRPRAAHPGSGTKSPYHPVRNAGPEEMTLPLRREWTKVDEAVDESFPASDPPATY